MLAFIRADASASIGAGHVTRCLTLAGDLTRRGMKVFFIMRRLPGNLGDYLDNLGYAFFWLPAPECGETADYFAWLKNHWSEDAEATHEFISQAAADYGLDGGKVDLLVVDNYALDYRWERRFRSLTKEIMVIDDLADRKHDCDRLLDQNYYRNMTERYRDLTPSGCQLLLGPRHALLRPEFRRIKANLRWRDGNIGRILLFFGGGDPTGETVKALAAARLWRAGIAVDVVVGTSNPRKEEVEKICFRLPKVNFYCQVEKMAELMDQADLAIGAGGSATWERCYLGLPALILTVAGNQTETVRDLAAIGAALDLGPSEQVDAGKIAGAVEGLLLDPQRLLKMSERSLALFE